MNKKVFSGIIVSSVISISACQAEKREKIEINQNDQNPEKTFVIQEGAQKIAKKFEKANTEASQKLQEFNMKLVETQKEHEKNKRSEAE